MGYLVSGQSVGFSAREHRSLGSTHFLEGLQPVEYLKCFKLGDLLHNALPCKQQLPPTATQLPPKKGCA